MATRTHRRAFPLFDRGGSLFCTKGPGSQIRIPLSITLGSVCDSRYTLADGMRTVYNKGRNGQNVRSPRQRKLARTGRAYSVRWAVRSLRSDSRCLGGSRLLAFLRPGNFHGDQWNAVHQQKPHTNFHHWPHPLAPCPNGRRCPCAPRRTEATKKWLSRSM